MQLRFTKMQGLGNDFVVIDAIRQAVALDSGLIGAIAERRFGVGCDQLLMVERPRLADTEFHYRIFNADGGEVEQCGNGARCFARFVYDQGLTSNRTIAVGTAAGRIVLQLMEDGQVKVDMGEPRLAPEQIPIQAAAEQLLYPLWVDGREYRIGAVSMGNPHAIFQVEDLTTTDVSGLGAAVERHPSFPQRVNVGFMQLLSPSRIALRVFERGAGETLACGTGACAAVVHGRLRGLLDAEVVVGLPGGDLVVSWQGVGNPVWMIGPAITVFEGVVDLAGLTRSDDRRLTPTKG